MSHNKRIVILSATLAWADLLVQYEILFFSLLQSVRYQEITYVDVLGFVFVFLDLLLTTGV